MDILLDNGWDLDIGADGDVRVGETAVQDVGSLLQLNKADLKYAPLLGPGLIRFTKGKATKEEILKEIALNLKIDGKRINDFKQYINVK
ncbi:MAG: hypothetical protein ACEQSR_01315 [Candidatus Methylacidiphilales bacterium]